MARLIRASEVGEYVFCHRAWWLRTVAGLTPGHPTRLKHGTLRHRRHGLHVVASRVLLIAGLVLLALGLVGALAGL